MHARNVMVVKSKRETGGMAVVHVYSRHTGCIYTRVLWVPDEGCFLPLVSQAGACMPIRAGRHTYFYRDDWRYWELYEL